MLRLDCKVQQYAWGKVGSDSAVAQLYVSPHRPRPAAAHQSMYMQSQASGSEIDAQSPYAEYWFGTHKNGPASVQLPGGTTQLLSDYLMSNPAIMGFESVDGALPYLMKVLSVAKALSIQSHPDKALAEKLHAERPEVYKDPNHKPEMALALTPFEGMCGFRSVQDISAQISCTQPLAAALDQTAAVLQKAAEDGDDASQKSALKGVFRALMTLPAAQVATHTQAISTWLAQKQAEGSLTAPDQLALRLAEQFPGDVGIFAPYLLNHVFIQPGEAFFMAANEPHAYLAGDCVECMACSDNVVRAGLTPKLRDVDTLLDMLTYATGEPGAVQPQATAPGVASFVPPVPDFAVDRCVAQGGQVCKLPPSDVACIIMVAQGSGTAQLQGGGATGVPAEASLSPGTVWLQPANSELAVSAEGDAELLLFRARRNTSAPPAAAAAQASA